MVCLLTHHVSEDPTNWRDIGKAWGGKEILYNTKYLLHLLGSDKACREKWGQRVKRIVRYRYPDDLDKDDEALRSKPKHPVMLALDYGYRDITVEDEIKKKVEKKPKRK